MAISEGALKAGQLESEKTLEMDQFHAKSHFWGKATIWAVICLTLALPIYLSFVMGYHPGWTPIIAGFIAYAAAIGYAWVVEPVSYYPTLGISGTYQAFLTGNIANMCLPSAAAAQNAIGAQPGTKKGEITAALAIATASLLNLGILILIIISGSYLISMIPPSVQAVFPYIVPAIFGGILAQFAVKKPVYGAIALSIALLINFLPIVPFLRGFICIALTIAVCLTLEKSKQKHRGIAE